MNSASVFTSAAFRSAPGDPDLALLCWKAARGLALSAMFGPCALSADERARLFDRLLDGTQWPSGGAHCRAGREIVAEEMKRAFVACGMAVARFGRSLLAVVPGRL